MKVHDRGWDAKTQEWMFHKNQKSPGQIHFHASISYNKKQGYEWQGCDNFVTVDSVSCKIKDSVEKKILGVLIGAVS